MCIVICTLLLSRPARGAWVETGYVGSPAPSVTGRAPQGARGLKPAVPVQNITESRRAPQGARGLKPFRFHTFPPPQSSRPARGAWVETVKSTRKPTRRPQSRPARGAWVETESGKHGSSEHPGRAPQGARGLKQHGSNLLCIVISRAPQGARGLKHRSTPKSFNRSQSRPARGAWVETNAFEHYITWGLVAPRKGRVG